MVFDQNRIDIRPIDHIDNILELSEKYSTTTNKTPGKCRTVYRINREKLDEYRRIIQNKTSSLNEKKEESMTLQNKLADTSSRTTTSTQTMSQREPSILDRSTSIADSESKN